MATIDTYKIKIEIDGDQQLKKAQVDTAKLQQGLKDAKEEAKKTEQAFDTLGTALDRVGKFAAGAFALIVGSAVRMADEMVDVAQATGTTAGFVRALSLSLEEAGGKFDGAGKILINFYKSLDEVANLNADTTKAFMDLGLSLDDLKDKTNIQIFQKVIEKFAEMDAGAQRTALGIKIFGKEFANIDPKVLDEILRTKDFAKLEEEMLKAAAAVGAMEQNFRMLQEAALRLLAPLIGDVDNLRISSEQAEKIIKILGITMAVAFSASVAANIIKVAGAIGFLASKAAILSKNPVFRALALGGLAIGGAIAGKSLMEDEPANTTTAPTAAGGATTTAATTANNLAKIRKIREEEVADTIARQFALQNKQVQIAQDYQKLVNGTADLSKQEADRKKVEYEIDKQLMTQIADLDAKIAAEEEKKSFANKEAIAAYKAQKDILTAQAEEQKKLNLAALKNAETERAKTVELQKQLGLMQQQSQADMAALQAEQMRKVIAGEITQTDAKNAVEIAKIKEDGALKVAQLERQIANEKDEIRQTELRNQIDAIKAATDFAISEKEREVREKQALEESYAAGAVSAIESIAEGFKPYKMAQDAVNKTWGTISNSIDSFVETGKFKFSDFARSIVADLAKMIAKALIFRAISGFLGGLGIPLPPGLAEGGPAEKGKPYMVGERGPELFIPKNAGTVIPNDKLGMASASAGQSQQQPVVNNYTYNNNINAVDAKSVAALFYENRKSLFGAANQARKELPYGAAA